MDVQYNIESFLDEKLSNFVLWSCLKVKMLEFLIMPSLCGLLQFDPWEFSTLKKYSQGTTEASAPCMFRNAVRTEILCSYKGESRSSDFKDLGPNGVQLESWHVTLQC
uniref:Uncharacterized protein n=1 Tax=Sus scrofa TaxID=9823 RepID=A0A480I4L2_PIG